MPLVDPLNALLWTGRNGLPPTPDTLNLGYSCHLHFSHRFLSTRGVVMLENKEIKKGTLKSKKRHEPYVFQFSLLRAYAARIQTSNAHFILR